MFFQAKQKLYLDLEYVHQNYIPAIIKQLNESVPSEILQSQRFLLAYWWLVKLIPIDVRDQMAQSHDTITCKQWPLDAALVCAALWSKSELEWVLLH